MTKSIQGPPSDPALVTAWKQQHGLRVWATCEHCSAQGTVEFPDWSCYRCDKANPQSVDEEAAAAYTRWEEEVEEQYESRFQGVPRMGGGEWANGWEITTIPHDGDPENYTAYSLHDYQQKLKRTNVREDGTTFDGKAPRWLAPGEERHS